MCMYMLHRHLHLDSGSEEVLDGVPSGEYLELHSAQPPRGRIVELSLSSVTRQKRVSEYSFISLGEETQTEVSLTRRLVNETVVGM